MPALSYGLNLSKKPGSSAARPAASRQKALFGDDSESEDGKNESTTEAIGVIGGLAPNPKTSQAKQSNQSSSSRTSTKKPQSTSYLVDLSSSHSASKHAAQAQGVDPSVYDYDDVYDSLHAKPKKSEGPPGPKYMASLLAAAEVRKRDQLRAKEKMLAREREAEGEEFADKEKFVTAAYKAQQEEVRRLEEEERKREEEELDRKRRGGGGMKVLYKGLLEREEAKHEAALNAAADGRGKDDDVEKINEKSEAEMVKEMGAVVNDDGQVVDKRQLLKAGLNVTSKPKPAIAMSSRDSNITPSATMAVLQGHGGSKTVMRERQSRMIEAQLEEAAKRAADDEEVEKEVLQRAAKTRKTGSEISSAKERYLQRKREAEAAKSSGKDA